MIDYVQTDRTAPGKADEVRKTTACMTRAGAPHNSSILGWKILFMKPILGDLNGYWSGSSTWIFQIPPANGAEGAHLVSVNAETDGDHALSVGP